MNSNPLIDDSKTKLRSLQIQLETLKELCFKTRQEAEPDPIMALAKFLDPSSLTEETRLKLKQNKPDDALVNYLHHFIQ